MAFARVAGVGGMSFVVLLIVGAVLLGDQPLRDESVEGIQRYLGEDQGLHRASMVVGFLSLPFFAVFLGGLTAQLRASDSEHGEGWAASALAGGILMFGIAMIGDTMAVVLFLRGGEGLDASTLRALWDAVFVVHGLVGVAAAALAGSVAVPVLRHRLWPAWYGWLAALVAVVGFVSVFGMAWTSSAGDVVGFSGFIGLLVWTLVTSVLLYRRGGRSALGS